MVNKMYKINVRISRLFFICKYDMEEVKAMYKLYTCGNCENIFQRKEGEEVLYAFEEPMCCPECRESFILKKTFGREDKYINVKDFNTFVIYNPREPDAKVKDIRTFLNTADYYLDKMPASAVKADEQGHWILSPEWGVVTCSKCSWGTSFVGVVMRDFKFCPKCGVHMTKKLNETDDGPEM